MFFLPQVSCTEPGGQWPQPVRAQCVCICYSSKNRSVTLDFLSNRLKLNRLQNRGILYLLLLVLAVLIVFIGARVWKKDKKRLLILVPAALAIPIACNAYMLLAGDKLELQMTAGLAMLAPLTIILASARIPKGKG